MFKNVFGHSNKKDFRSKSEERLRQTKDNHDKEIHATRDINDSTLYESSDSENKISEKMFEIFELEIEQKYECTFARELEQNINF